MSVLLDTHVLLWWQAGGERLSPSAVRAIQLADAILISPLTCWEVVTLHRLGRVRLDREPVAWVRDLLLGERIVTAGLSPEAAALAGELGPSFPGDPIDRLLYATARDHRVAFVSKDERLRAFASTARDVDVVW
jgi:PIN domain nuclease of toxin-antitoxin system